VQWSGQKQLLHYQHFTQSKYQSKEEIMSTEKKKELEVFGATILGFANACKDLNIVAGSKAGELVSDVEVNTWYPFKRLRDIEATVIETYENAGPMMERAGAEMMCAWYNFGPGKEIITGGVDFLKFQSGSQGYASVVKGPADLVGSFELIDIDENKGEALIHSTTPFNKDQERGVIVGGMSAPGDLDYIDVNNDADQHYFKIKFA